MSKPGRGNNPPDVIHIECLPHHAEHGHSVNIGLMNCQSVMNKVDGITYYIQDMGKDIVALTKTGLSGT